jgi:ClpX C4-type zinc finger
MDPPKPDQTEPSVRGYCSFCRENNRDVGPLAEAPSRISAICYSCVLICKQLLEDHQRLGRPRSV